MADMTLGETGRRFMGAAIRLARRHEGWTATNPSVACLIVRDGVIVGRGVTARGGRPHAEPLALEEAGELARGATAYVTLEPCAHHGRTPPCAETLIAAGVGRVDTATVDPDPRVDERGHAMIRQAGIPVEVDVEGAAAREGLAAYLVHKRTGRPFVTLKLAVSPDGLLGLAGIAQASVTGPEARAQAHLMRARHHAIMIGAGTAAADDPELTCRLAGLEDRSPLRIVIDARQSLGSASRLVASTDRVRLLVVGPPNPGLAGTGVEYIACELVDGRVALPELLDDLGARGIQSLLVEGGARLAASLLAEGLVDRLALFAGARPISLSLNAGQGIASPVRADSCPPGFRLTGEWKFGEDRLRTFEPME